MRETTPSVAGRIKRERVGRARHSARHIQGATECLSRESSQHWILTIPPILTTSLCIKHSSAKPRKAGSNDLLKPTQNLGTIHNQGKHLKVDGTSKLSDFRFTRHMGALLHLPRAHGWLKFHSIHLKEPLNISESTNRKTENFSPITNSKFITKARSTQSWKSRLRWTPARQRGLTDPLGEGCRVCAWRSTDKEAAAKCAFLFAGHYAQESCVYGPGDLPWIIQSPSLFANKVDPSTDPLVVTCLERWHRLKVLQQAEVPVEAHWHFQQESHFNTRLNRWAASYKEHPLSCWYHSVSPTCNKRTFNQRRKNGKIIPW